MAQGAGRDSNKTFLGGGRVFLRPVCPHVLSCRCLKTGSCTPAGAVNQNCGEQASNSFFFFQGQWLVVLFGPSEVE